MSFAPLYKRTTTGAIQVWRIEVEGDKHRTITSKLGGKEVVAGWTVCQPRNVGRSNATTAHEQALSEAQANWDKKQRDGYSLSVEEAESSDRFRCMKADMYVDPEDPKKSRKPRVLKALEQGTLVWSQPKLDGVRLLASKDKLLSRSGRPITSVPHIADALAPVFAKYPDLVIDGELYEHSMRDNFNQLISIVRKADPKAHKAEHAGVMQYWVYDCAGSHGSLSYRERLALLDTLFKEDSGTVRLVPTNFVQDEAAIDAWHKSYLDGGFEGQMLRIDAPYESKRSDKLLKRKEFLDEEFEVLDISEGLGNRSGGAGNVTVRDKQSNKTFNANVAGDLEQRQLLLKTRGRYIGGEVTVRFNDRTPDGIPRNPRAIAWYPGGRTT